MQIKVTYRSHQTVIRTAIINRTKQYSDKVCEMIPFVFLLHAQPGAQPSHQQRLVRADAETHIQAVARAQGTPWKRRRKGCRNQRWLRIPQEHSPENQLSSTHRDSRELKQYSGSLDGSYLSPLHICYGCIAQCSYQISNNQSRVISESCLFLGPFSFYLAAPSSLDIRIYAQSYCNLLCHFLVNILGGLFFFLKGNRVKVKVQVRVGERGDVGIDWEGKGTVVGTQHMKEE